MNLTDKAIEYLKSVGVSERTYPTRIKNSRGQVVTTTWDQVLTETTEAMADLPPLLKETGRNCQCLPDWQEQYLKRIPADAVSVYCATCGGWLLRPGERAKIVKPKRAPKTGEPNYERDRKARKRKAHKSLRKSRGVPKALVSELLDFGKVLVSAL